MAKETQGALGLQLQEWVPQITHPNPKAQVGLQAVFSDFAKKRPETAQHACGVVALTTLVGDRLPFPKEDLPWFTLACWCHDFGKTRVPDALLYAQRRLTEDELNKGVRVHAFWGSETYLAVTGGQSASTKDLLVASAIYAHHCNKADRRTHPRAPILDPIINPQARRWAVCLAILDFTDAAMDNTRPEKRGWPVPTREDLKARLLKFLETDISLLAPNQQLTAGEKMQYLQLIDAICKNYDRFLPLRAQVSHLFLA